MDVKNERDYLGRTAVFVAAQNGCLGALQVLWEEAGANLETPDNRRATPLHIAAYNGHLDVVEYLLTEGVEMDVVDDNDNSPISLAAQQGHFRVVRLLIERGASWNFQLPDGRTILHILAENNEADILYQILNPIIE